MVEILLSDGGKETRALQLARSALSPLVGESWRGGIANSGVCGLPLSLTLPHKGGGNRHDAPEFLYASRSLS